MPSKRELLEQIEELAANQTSLSETISDLELALEDEGWTRLDFSGEMEFSREGLRKIAKLARLYYLKNPLVQRGVDVQTHYVYGQGVSFRAEAEPVNEVVQSFLLDSKNQAELTSHQSLMGKETELQVESNIFFTFFTNTITGAVTIRTIPFDEMSQIITNPEDRKDNWYYKRDWTQSNVDISTGQLKSIIQTVYYPDWRYSNPDKPTSIGDKKVAWDTPIYHVKTGGLPSMQFGVPEVYSALDWARAYKEFLENWATIMQAYARFASKLTTKGGSAGVAAAKAKLNTTLGTNTETNPPPLVASTFIGTEGVDIQPIRTAGATTPAEEGRRLLLMVCASMGLPETFFGDTSTGSLATAKSLDRPTELMMASRQTLWADVFKDIFEYVILQAVKAGNLPGRIEEDEDGNPTVILDDDPETGEPMSQAVNVSFPPILEHDVLESVGAIVDAATLKGNMPAGTIPDMETLSRMLLVALGADDLDGKIELMFPEEGQSTEAKLFVAAVEELREALKKVGDQPGDYGHRR